MSNKIPLICYLFTKYDKIRSLTTFIKNYKKYKAGYKHDLVICYKLLKNKEIQFLEKKIFNLKHLKFVDTHKENDWDFGSYGRVAKKFSKRIIFFMNSHSYPIKKNWLKIFMKYYDNKTIIATSGSYESITKQVKFKKPYNIISFFRKKIKGKKSFYDFPNPHLNTSNFLIKAKDLNTYLKGKKFNTKYETWKLESGYNSLTNTFKRRGYKLLVVNSEGKQFTEDRWMLSETFHYKKQSKNLISDKHSRKYLKLNKFDKAKSQKAVWGV